MTESTGKENTARGNSRLLVLGIGNILLGDEGVGVKVIHKLENEKIPDHVDLLDGGTGGFHLLSYLQDYSHIIMVDATLDGKDTGTISKIRPKFSNEFPPTLSSHDIGLKDLIESASLLGSLPDITLFTVSVNPDQSLCMDLSDTINIAADKVSQKILDLLHSGGL